MKYYDYKECGCYDGFTDNDKRCVHYNPSICDVIMCNIKYMGIDDNNEDKLEDND
jgi:hypothetical protein